MDFSLEPQPLVFRSGFEALSRQVPERQLPRSRVTVDSYICPTCGGKVKVGAPCSGCGSSSRRRKGRVAKAPEKRSWEQSEEADGLDLPDEAFDYEDFVAREFGSSGRGSVIRVRWYWWATALFLVIVLVLFSFSGIG